MKRKVLIIFLGLVVLSQIPFVYRRYRLRRLNNAIQQLATQRVRPTESDYRDYKGAIHVHSFLGGHSTGNFAELISAAKANQLDFVIMTEHPQASFDTASMTLNGMHDGVLFVNGNEVSSRNSDRILLIPGASNSASLNTQQTQEIVDQQRTSGGISFAAYPAESGTWQSADGINGVEVYNLFTNARQINRLVTFFDAVWSSRAYGDLMFANFFARPATELQRWDAAIAGSNRKLVAMAGNDAHANVGLSLSDANGNQLIGVKLDPYERSFRLVRTHVLIPRDRQFGREALMDALTLGHCYISFDLFGAPDGFEFRVSNSEKIMGDDVALEAKPKLIVRSPIAARILLYRNGEIINQAAGTTAEFEASSAGAYRVEIYLDTLPSPAKGSPWILSNPIYIR